MPARIWSQLSPGEKEQIRKDLSKIKIIFLGCGKTLTDDRWVVANKEMGMTEGDEKFLKGYYKEGIINYKEWIDLDLRLWKKRGEPTRENFEKIFSELNSPDPRAKEVVSKLKKKHRVFAVTGQNQHLANAVQEEFEIHCFATNVFIYDSGGYLKTISFSHEDSSMIMNVISVVSQAHSVLPDEILFVDDGETGSAVFESRMAISVAFESSSKVNQEKASLVIQELIDLLDILR